MTNSSSETLLPVGSEREEEREGGGREGVLVFGQFGVGGIFGGLISPVCSYILSESILCHSTVRFALCCIVLKI